jgi:hypothetical protein
MTSAFLRVLIESIVSLPLVVAVPVAVESI